MTSSEDFTIFIYMVCQKLCLPLSRVSAEVARVFPIRMGVKEDKVAGSIPVLD